MKRAPLLVSLLGVLVCAHIAHALTCFTCEDQTSNSKCLRMTGCSADEKRCLTIGIFSGTDDSKRLITKKCAKMCPSEQEYAINSVFCCEQNLCNSGPPK